jgi:hypothetical protein
MHQFWKGREERCQSIEIDIGHSSPEALKEYQQVLRARKNMINISNIHFMN